MNYNRLKVVKPKPHGPDLCRVLTCMQPAHAYRIRRRRWGETFLLPVCRHHYEESPRTERVDPEFAHIIEEAR